MAKEKTIELPFVRNPYNYDMSAAGDESGLSCKDPSLAQQNMKDECDINVIVKRFGITGELPTGARIPTYGDFEQIDDFRTAYEIVTAAQDAFAHLPASLRVRFNNDPHEFVEFCENPANLAELRALGLAVPEAPKTAQEATKEEPKPKDAAK